MSSLGGKKKSRRPQKLLEKSSKEMLSDYVTGVVWSSDGKTLAASSAAGEVILWQGNNSISILQEPIESSIDCLSFSHDGKYLAAGGQNGQVKIWYLPTKELVTTLENAPAWVDQLAWSCSCHQLAFSLGRSVQVWDLDTQAVVTTLNFEASSVFSLAWHPIAAYLAIAGYQGVKIWCGEDWHDDPYLLSIPSASQAIAWSPDGKYLACGNLDQTLAVVEWGNPHPWVMRGFPGKVRSLAWSNLKTVLGAPLLAAASTQSAIVWEKQWQEADGWEAWELEGHTETVTAIAFSPDRFLLASASEDGRVCLWDSAEELVQILSGADDGFSCLAWQPQGQFLAAGGQNGELLIWAKSIAGQGFG
ncbi:WD40 repeat domain-containing protein [Planktothricoides sp. SR001]|uniref:WD40 domain-containing protein n=1 Tax=Planktothricoides sp. SR001 TaxID=1705388 RepID=UPI0009EB5A01|nr:WD40 repeat domain-containing protein [Planktothricoides sp. SR001]